MSTQSTGTLGTYGVGSVGAFAALSSPLAEGLDDTGCSVACFRRTRRSPRRPGVFPIGIAVPESRCAARMSGHREVKNGAQG